MSIAHRKAYPKPEKRTGYGEVVVEVPLDFPQRITRNHQRLRPHLFNGLPEEHIIVLETKPGQHEDIQPACKTCIEGYSRKSLYNLSLNSGEVRIQLEGEFTHQEHRWTENEPSSAFQSVQLELQDTMCLMNPLC